MNMELNKAHRVQFHSLKPATIAAAAPVLAGGVLEALVPDPDPVAEGVDDGFADEVA